MYEPQLPEQKENKIIRDYASELYMCGDFHGMSEWEKDFCFEMMSRRTFSEKQKTKVLELVERYDL